MSNLTDLVVVGGGLGGLSLAASVARRGASVTLVERHGAVGGRAASESKAGFWFNRGAHALYRGGPAERVLRGLDAWPRGAEPPLRGALACVGSTLHALPVGPMSLMTTGLLDAAGKVECGRLLAQLDRLEVGPEVSVETWLASSVRSPRARAFVRAVFRLATYCGDVDRLPAALALSQLRVGNDPGVIYVDGGWQSIVDVLHARAKKAGVRFVTGDAARRVVHDGNVRAVSLASGESLPARAVAICTGPGTADALLDREVASLRAASSSLVPVRAACLELGLAKLPRRRAAVVLGIDRPTYLTVQSAVAAVAPEGLVCASVIRYLRDDEPNDPDVRLQELESFLDVTQPGWREHELARQWLPAMVVTHARADRGLDARPSIDVPEVGGLYLAGDWVGPEGWLADASFASAAAVADRVAHDLALGSRPIAAVA